MKLLRIAIFCLGWVVVVAAARAADAAASARLLVKNAVSLTMTEGQRRPFTGYMLVGADGKPTKVAAGAPPDDAAAASVFDATGKIIIPGFISAHSHIWQSVNCGLGADQTLLDWIGSFMSYTAASRPEDLYWYTLHGCLDFTRHGISADAIREKVDRAKHQ